MNEWHSGLTFICYFRIADCDKNNPFKQPTESNFFLYLFIPILYMFRATKCSSSGESIVSIRHLICRWSCGMQV